MSWTPDEEAAFKKRRGQRNLVIGLVLAAFAALFYFITVARLHL